MEPNQNVASADAEYVKGFEQAYANYVRQLQDVGAPQEPQARAAEAYRLYAELVQEWWASETVQKRAMEAYAGYVQALQEALAPEAVRARTRAAYREYVRALRDAWLQIDPDLIPPEQMGAIAQTLMAVAWTAASASTDATLPYQGTATT